MRHKWIIGLVLSVVAALASFGVVPAFWGIGANVVLNELEKIPVEDVADAVLNGEVVRVVDGDTIEVRISQADGELEMLRLIGVDTPETKHPGMPIQFYGPEATQFTKNLCLGQNVILHVQEDGPDRGKYGRLLVYVELPTGEILNEKIISDGFGYSYTKYPHAEADKYNKLQLSAIQGKRGLWGDVKFSDLPEWLRKSNPDILK